VTGNQFRDEGWSDAGDELPCWKKKHVGGSRVVISVMWYGHVGCGEHKMLEEQSC